MTEDTTVRITPITSPQPHSRFLEESPHAGAHQQEELLGEEDPGDLPQGGLGLTPQVQDGGSQEGDAQAEAEEHAPVGEGLPPVTLEQRADALVQQLHVGPERSCTRPRGHASTLSPRESLSGESKQSLRHIFQSCRLSPVDADVALIGWCPQGPALLRTGVWFSLRDVMWCDVMGQYRQINIYNNNNNQCYWKQLAHKKDVWFRTVTWAPDIRYIYKSICVFEHHIQCHINRESLCFYNIR